MKTDSTEKLTKAARESEYNNEALHAQRVRDLAHDLLNRSNKDMTPEIPIGKRNVTFHKGDLSTPESITMTVDEKTYSGADMDKMICQLDHIGSQYKRDRDKNQRMTKIKDKA